MNHTEVFVAVNEYVYKNPLIRWVEDLNHRTIRFLRKSKDRVYDFGCGPGAHSKYVEGKYLGVDTLDEMVELTGRAVKGDICDLPLETGVVSSSVCSNVLEHIGDLEGAVREIYRVTKIGGEFILSTPCEGFLYRLGRRFTTKRFVERRTGEGYSKFLGEEHLHKPEEILKTCSRYFRKGPTIGVPFVVPLLSINVFLVRRYLKEVE